MLILILVVFDVLFAILGVMLVDVAHLDDGALLTQLEDVAVVGLGVHLTGLRVELNNKRTSLTHFLRYYCKFCSPS